MTGLLKKLGELVLGAILGKLAAWLKEWVERRKRAREAKLRAEMSVEPLQNAHTGEEIDDAADDALSQF